MATDCITQVTFGFEPKDKPVVSVSAKIDGFGPGSDQIH